MKNFFDEIKEIIEKLLEIIGIDSSIEVKQSSEGTIISILTPEANFLIGQGGVNLYAFQHLVRLIAGKKLNAFHKAEEKTGSEEKEENKQMGFVLDVNNYRQGRADMIKDLAIDRANQVASERKAISLSPMSSYERRIVHLALQDRDDVACESEGEGQERHVVIKPAI